MIRSLSPQSAPHAGARTSRTPDCSAMAWSPSKACTMTVFASTGPRASSTLPESIRSRSRMSLISRTRRSVLLTAISSMRCPFSAIGPSKPLLRRPSAPRMDVNGVRSSWLTVDTNSPFRRSMARRSVTSRNVTTAPRLFPSSSRIAVAEYSTGKLVPSGRQKVWSTTANDSPRRMASVFGQSASGHGVPSGYE